ncbi:MAG: exo-beta-N-acetylmuramidase NamZ domain-containing protein [Verrucomicrobiota bacterium]
MRQHLCRFLGLAGFLAAFSSTTSQAEPMDRGVLGKMDAQINAAIAEKKLPGAVIWVEHDGDVYHKAFGDRAVEPRFEEMTRDTIFDAASLTKIVAGTPAIMILVERDKVKLDEPVSTYIPEFKGNGKEAITVKQLLTHTSGLRPDIDTKAKWKGNDTAIRMASQEKLENKPGEKVVYSDINLFLVGEIVQRVSKMKLNEFVAKEIYEPLKMTDTGYLPPRKKLARVAPTEKTDGEILRGVVHDPTARYMGGVAGHAGIFTTAPDLARYARMLLNEGELDGVRIFKPETIKLMTSVQTPPENPMRRGLGWDIDSGYSRPRGEIFPLGSFGHTGFTGNAFWIDPFSKTFWIFLSNRVHPNGKGNVLELYKSLGTVAAEAVTDFDFSYVPDALPPKISEKQAASTNRLSNDVPSVLNGIDVLEKQKFAPLKGMKVGLITNHTGKNRQRYPTIDLLMNAPEVELKALFAPEHGLYGLLDEAVADSVDERTGLPVYSLYGKNRAPTAEQMRGLDALVFDIQDVGCRFYTYISTMGLAMEAAGKHGLKYFVLDRVNPIGGVALDGPMLTGKTSFVGYHKLPLRYGMTIGELAQMFKEERKVKIDLTVIPMEGWKRQQWFDETAQPWGNLSPNMRNITQATLYAGVGVLETTAVSVGRGTDTPFEVLGAPYIHDLKLAYELNQLGLKGVRFVPIRFTPDDSVFKNQSCAGINIVLTDRDHCEVVDIGISIAKILNRWYPEQFGLKKMDRLLINKQILAAIKEDKSLEEIKKLYEQDLQDFAQRRESYLLYK